MPTPDDHGRYRVRRKGDKTSPIWSTRNYNPEIHAIHPGQASDTYGNALPPKPYQPLGAAPTNVTSTAPAGSTNATDEGEDSDER